VSEADPAEGRPLLRAGFVMPCAAAA
jgi:hypothetical protein